MIALAAVLLGWSAWLLTPGSPRKRARHLLVTDLSAARSERPAWLLPAGSVSVGLAAAMFAGVVVGVVVGVLMLVLLPRLLARLQSQQEVASQRALQRQLPPAVDLLAATLAAGVPVAAAVHVVAHAQDEPLRSSLARVAAALELGATGAEAWLHPDFDMAIRDLGMAFIRSETTGSSLSALLSEAAGDLRQRRRTELEVMAREAGVRSFIPLATCFLPAFIVLAGVPTVVSMAQGTGLLDTLSP